MRFFIWGIILMWACNNSPQSICDDYYNLNFSEHRVRDGFRWRVEMKDDTLKSKVGWYMDTHLKRQVFRIGENRFPDGRCLALHTVVDQQFPLYRVFKQGDISVDVKEENLEEGWLKVYSLDKEEEIVYRDSIRIYGDEWKNYKLSIPLQNIHYLWVSFCVDGKPCAEHSGANISIDNLKLYVDGISINSESLPGKDILPELKSDLLQPLSLTQDSLIGQISLFKAHPRIIGLGETMHGSASFEQIKNQVIRWLVENRNCKLIMLELPGMLLFKWDLYIQGGNVPIDEITEELVGSPHDRRNIAALLDFLREYNSKAERKVHIAGIDRSMGLSYFPVVYDYFYYIYKETADPIIYEVLKTNLLPEYLSALLEGAELKKSMGDFEFDWFKQVYFFKFMERNIPGVKEHGTMNYRDYIIWRHAYYALKAAKLAEDECAVVEGHWGHINKWNTGTTLYHSLGYYLSQSYGKDYCAIGLLGGEGAFATFRSDQQILVSDYPLPVPVKGSLEAAAVQCGVSYFYYPVDNIGTMPVLIRNIAAGGNDRRFMAFNLERRMDGFIFSRVCEGSNIPAEQRTPDAYQKIFGKRLIRMMARNKELGIVVP